MPLVSVVVGLGIGELLDIEGGLLDAVITGPMISATTATGGILILGLGLPLLELKEGRVADMLPALSSRPCSSRRRPPGRSSFDRREGCW